MSSCGLLTLPGLRSRRRRLISCAWGAPSAKRASENNPQRDCRDGCIRVPADLSSVGCPRKSHLGDSCSCPHRSATVKPNCSKFGKISEGDQHAACARVSQKSVIGFSLASTPYRALMSEQPPPPNLFAGYRPESSRLCRPCDCGPRAGGPEVVRARRRRRHENVP